MLTSWSDMSTPPELSTASVLTSPPPCPVFDAAALREPEVAAFADHPRPHVRRVDAHAIVGAIADVGVVLARRLDVGADAAVVEQIDLARVRMAGSRPRRSALPPVEIEQRAHLGAERDRLRRPIEDAAAGADERRVVVAPGRTRQLEQPLALAKLALGIGIGVEEDVDGD